MECAICWIPLKEIPNEDLSKPSDAKRPKMSIKESNAASNLCVTPCGHIFHRSCVETWISQNGNKRCPTCRRRATKESLYPVFLDIDKKDKFSKKETSSLLPKPAADNNTDMVHALTLNRVEVDEEQGRGDFNSELNGNLERDDTMEEDSGESDYDTSDEEDDSDQDDEEDDSDQDDENEVYIEDTEDDDDDA